MRLPAILCALCLATALPGDTQQEPSPVLRYLTVAQLEQSLTAAHGVKDKKLAEQISEMKLTERLSETEELRLAEELPGTKSRLALLAIADESSFLDLPASEIPDLPPPSQATQASLIHQAEDYLQKTVPELPNFLATRTTIRFWGTSGPISRTERDGFFPQMANTPAGQRLDSLGTTVDTVGYSQGVEIFDDLKEALKTECKPGELTGDDQFGEILNRLADEIAHGQITWSHWENSSAGPLAVFDYVAIYNYHWPRHCPNEMYYLPLETDSRGEIAVEIISGAILRLTESVLRKARTDDQQPPLLGESETMVDYRSVEIGGKNYICPVRSVYIGLGPFPSMEITNPASSRAHQEADRPVPEGLNDLTFGDYRMFRSTSRTVPVE
jgi:hypothetical protein